MRSNAIRDRVVICVLSITGSVISTLGETRKVPVLPELDYHPSRKGSVFRLQGVDMENAFKEKKPWSSLATNFCVAVITFAIGIGAHWASTFILPQSTPQQPPPPGASYASPGAGTLRARILEAKAKGENTVQLGVIACGWDIGGLQTALSRDTIVLAELMGKKTYEDT